MNVVYMGTPDFAVEPLKELISNGYNVCGVFTQPDKPVGRKAVLTAPPVKEFALNNDIPVFQPATLKNGEGLKILKELAPDIVIVVAYGKILPPDFLNYPKYGCINIHGSLLPKYRGAAPIQWSVLNGEKYAGVTSIKMDEGLDTGDMILSEKLLIGENETSGELYERLSVLGADILIKTLDLIKNGKAEYVKQDDSLSVYAPLLSKALSPVDWSLDAFAVHKKICGLDPWPVAQTTLEGKTLKLFSSKLVDGIKDYPAGTSFITKQGLQVVCGDKKCVLIKEVQFEGKKRMNASDFFRGHSLKEGTVLPNS